MFQALNAGDVGHQHGLVLTVVEVLPYSLPLIVAGGGCPALRISQGDGRIVFDKNTDLAGSESELYFGDRMP